MRLSWNIIFIVSAPPILDRDLVRSWQRPLMSQVEIVIARYAPGSTLQEQLKQLSELRGKIDEQKRLPILEFAEQYIEKYDTEQDIINRYLHLREPVQEPIGRKSKGGTGKRVSAARKRRNSFHLCEPSEKRKLLVSQESSTKGSANITKRALRCSRFEAYEANSI